MKYRSFDVFDTCLARSVIAPSEVFRQIGEQIGRKAASGLPSDFADQFREWRRRAEATARRQSSREEITLAEIWTQLRLLLPASQISEELKEEIELEAEWNVLGAIAQMRSEIARRRAEGDRIIFISDTYLPESFLRRCLEKHGFLQPGDGLYVSCEIGLTKSTGNLFRHVLSAEKIEPGALIHTGDHEVSDITRARALGINCVLFGDATPTAAERAMAIQSITISPNLLDQAGRMRFTRLAQSPPEGPLGPGVQIYIHEFLGPFLSIFAAWVLAEARAKNLSRLYFASRDARLLWAVCRQLCQKHQLPIDCHYLSISRQAIMLPSVTEVSPQGIPWLERDFELSLLPRLLGKLELRYEDFIPAWSKKYPHWQRNDALTTREQRADFWQLLQQPPFSDQILSAAKAHRDFALSYFQKVGMLDPVRVGLVDLGWYLTCQGALQKIVSGRRGDSPVEGLYLALQHGYLGINEAGPASAIFYQAAPDLPRIKNQDVWLENVTMLEHLIGLSDHAGTRAYESEGPVRFPEQICSYNKDLFAEAEKQLLHYVDVMGDSWAPFVADRRQAGAIMNHLITSFFENPSAPCVEVLRKLSFSRDQNHADAVPLITPYTWAGVAGRVLPRRWRLNLGIDGAFLRKWPEASWLISPLSGRAARLAGLFFMMLVKEAKKAAKSLRN